MPHFGQEPAFFDFTSGCIGQLYSRSCCWAKPRPAKKLIDKGMLNISIPSKSSFAYLRFIFNSPFLDCVELSNPHSNGRRTVPFGRIAQPQIAGAAKRNSIHGEGANTRGTKNVRS